MKKPPTFKLASGERVVAVVPQYCAGPGWSNTPIWVYIVNSEKKVREECIQPEEQTIEQRLLFKLCEEAHGLMLATIGSSE